MSDFCPFKLVKVWLPHLKLFYWTAFPVILKIEVSRLFDTPEYESIKMVGIICACGLKACAEVISLDSILADLHVRVLGASGSLFVFL